MGRKPKPNVNFWDPSRILSGFGTADAQNILLTGAGSGMFGVGHRDRDRPPSSPTVQVRIARL